MIFKTFLLNKEGNLCPINHPVTLLSTPTPPSFPVKRYWFQRCRLFVILCNLMELKTTDQQILKYFFSNWSMHRGKQGKSGIFLQKRTKLNRDCWSFWISTEASKVQSSFGDSTEILLELLKKYAYIEGYILALEKKTEKNPPYYYVVKNAKTKERIIWYLEDHIKKVKKWRIRIKICCFIYKMTESMEHLGVFKGMGKYTTTTY